jgi:hypothetical protein
MPVLTDDPGMHLLGHVPERRNFADAIEIFESSDTPHLRGGRHLALSLRSQQSGAIYVATQ